MGLGIKIDLKSDECFPKIGPPIFFRWPHLEEGVELNVQSVQVSEQIRPEKIFRC